MTDFKTGDKVECIDNENGGEISLMVGETYEVIKVDRDFIYLAYDITIGWFHHRFKLVNSKIKNWENIL